MLLMVNHGGACCGIKTIYGFPGNGGCFDGKEPRIPPKYTPEGHWNPEFTNFFGEHLKEGFIRPGKTTEEIPEETILERLDRYLSNRKTYGIIEVVLTSRGNASIFQQKATWGPILEERGFKEVSSCHNSNSGNRIHVYHLISDKE